MTSANFSYPHPFYHCNLSVPLSRLGQPSSPKCWRHISIPPFRRTDRNVTSRRKTIDLTPPPQITTLLSNQNLIMRGLMCSFVFLAHFLNNYCQNYLRAPSVVRVDSFSPCLFRIYFYFHLTSLTLLRTA